MENTLEKVETIEKNENSKDIFKLFSPENLNK